MPEPVEVAAYKDQVAFVGVGTTNRFGTIPELDAFGMAAEAFRNALDDAGLKKEDIDGVIVGTGTGQPTPYDQMCHTLGLYPKVMLPYSNLGRLAGPSVTLMASLVYSGACNYLAFIYTNNSRTAKVRFGGGDEATSSMNAVYGYTSPGAAAAMHLQRYMSYYDYTEQDLGAIAVAQRKHANLNPMAVMYDRPMTLEDYMNARYIAAPMRLFDYCIINDAALVIIMTTAERARDLRKPPVYLAGTGLRSGYSHYRFDDDWLYPCYSDVANQAFSMAGIASRGHRCAVVLRRLLGLPAVPARRLRLLSPGRGPALRPERQDRAGWSAAYEHERRSPLGDLRSGKEHPGREHSAAARRVR